MRRFGPKSSSGAVTPGPHGAYREAMIEISHLTKVYGGVTAVNDVSFTVKPGIVTGFLGPNGAGKSTTMRILMGLESPTSGTATVMGRPIREHASPLTTVGALLDARSLNPARKARQSLQAIADTHGIPASRVSEVLALTGLSDVADKRSGGFSLGMGQRLGIASALLGDPRVLVFDEPVNGLDPEGVTWVRHLCRNLAAEGRTVLISSHLMSEMAQTADRIVVIGRGHVLADATVDEFIDHVGDEHVRVVSDDVARLGQALAASGAEVRRLDERRLQIRGSNSALVGRSALELGVALEELVPVRPSLEEAYLRMTANEVQYRSGQGLGGPGLNDQAGAPQNRPPQQQPTQQQQYAQQQPVPQQQQPGQQQWAQAPAPQGRRAAQSGADNQQGEGR